MIGLILLILFAVLPLIAYAYGTDSRDGSSDPGRPASPVGIR